MSDFLKEVSPGDPITALQFNRLIKVAKALAQANNVYIDGDGAYIRASSGTGGSTGRLAVLRDYGTGEENFILVNEIEPNSTQPWDGGWQIVDEDSFPVACFPGLLSKHYMIFIWRESTVERRTPILDLQKRNGVWIAFMHHKYLLPKRERNPAYVISDCVNRTVE